jgi:O-antigen ligase
MLGALALFAMVQLQFWNGKVYWVRRVLLLANPLGPYFNPTNLAGVMEIGVPGMLGLAWSRFRRHGRAAFYEPGFVVLVIAGTSCLAAVVVSASKLAVLLVSAALLALGLGAARTWRSRVVVLAVAVAIVASGALLIGGTRLGDRVELFLGRSQDAHLLEGRVVVWQSSGEMIRDFPVTGAGFGAFREMFQRYLPAGAAKRWGHAHNDYLELLLDGGVIAVLLVVWLIWGYASRVLRRLRSRSGGLSVTRLGLAIGVASLAAHALIDFNHQIPANALVWISCCALLIPVRTAERGAQGR